MTLLRDQHTESADFRRLLKEITFYLGYEATMGVSTKDAPVTTPMGK
jgi:uracil phosphoribosyltransferase